MPLNQAAPQSRDDGQIPVWDRFVRIFHWTLVGGVTLTFLSGVAHFPQAHAWIGYALVLLVTSRLVWGFTGSRHARFRDFLYSPSETLTYLRGMLNGHPPHYYGHNPAGALMVFTLLGLLLLILSSGLLTFASIDFDGPLQMLANQFSDELSYLFRNVHQTLPWLGLGLVALHVGGVVVGSIQHRENLVRSMWTGLKSPSTTQSEEQ